MLLLKAMVLLIKSKKKKKSHTVTGGGKEEEVICTVARNPQIRQPLFKVWLRNVAAAQDSASLWEIHDQ